VLGRAFERRAISFEDVYGPDISDFAVDAYGGMGGRRTAAGIRVTQDNALEVGALWACVSLIADSVASLPIDVFVPTADGGRKQVTPPRWISEPNLEQTPYDFWHAVMVSLLLDGNAFIHLTGDHDQPDEAIVLNPRAVEIGRDNTDRRDLQYVVKPTMDVLTKHEVLHVRGFTRPGEIRGLSPIAAARQSIGLAKVAEEFASRFFSNGATVGGVLETDADLDEPKVRALAAMFEKKHTGVHRAHRPMVLTKGLKWNRTQVAPNEAQMLETRARQVEEICRYYRVPLSMVGEITKHASAGGGKGMAGMDLGYVKHTTRPWYVRLEQGFGRRLPAQQFMRFNVSALLRASDAERWAVHQIARNVGAKTINEIRGIEDDAPLDDPRADDAFAPLNSSHSGDPGTAGDIAPTD
jgi:HK97 family phage portal protein